MIYTNIPYNPATCPQNLGLAYNLFMQTLKEDDWACFLDHDAMFTTGTWYQQLEQIIALPDKNIGLVTAVTNRVGNVEQLTFPKDAPEALNHDIYFHMKVGKDLYYAEGNSLREARALVSGVMMLLSKKTWRKVGGFNEGFLNVDRSMDEKIRKAGLITYIADGIYVYHWYRAAPEEGGLTPYGYDKKTYLPPV